MRKIVIGLCVFLLASCSLNIESVDERKDGKDVDPLAVDFGVYVNRGLSTKAGWAGELTTESLRDNARASGFGVFSYFGNGTLYNEYSKPDFMYNQQVAFDSTYMVWRYSPIKYWPNEYGTAASSEAVDRLTFFSYAPYVEVTPSTGRVTGSGETGILGMKRNIEAGDPLVMYGSSLTPGTGVDLCWGVASDNFTSSVDGNNNTVEKGKPFIDVIKPKTGDRVAFEFNHALAQLNVQVDADINDDTPGGDGKTKIYVRSVTFKGFALRGTLNLNSSVDPGPVWYNFAGEGRLSNNPIIVYDGRTDGSEGIASASDASEKPSDLNPDIVQSQPYAGTPTPGVTATTVNLFNNASSEAPVMVIPLSGVPLTITIVYDVETEDPNLSGKLSDGETPGISTENCITKSVEAPTGDPLILSAGFKYVLKLHLGLTSVKFDAEVKGWDNTTYAAPIDVDLPANSTPFGTISFTSGGDPYTGATVWRNVQSLAAPIVKVTANDGTTDITENVTFTWESSDTEVATVDADGGVSLTGKAGVALIKATADNGENTISKSYTVCVNEVTGITSITANPASAKCAPGSSIDLRAKLEHTNYGTITSWPTVAWTSGTEAAFTVSPENSTATHSGTNTVAQTTATAVADGTSTITATVDAAFTSSTVSLTKVLTCETVPIVYSFRGYEISKGILKRDAEREYSLTEGSNQLETIVDFYGQNSSIDVYYFKWADLKTELGSDGDNISQTGANCLVFPVGWTLPSETDWNTIINGTSTGIIVNGSAVTANGFAFAQVTVNENKTVYGLLLIPDNVNISCEHLNNSTIGNAGKPYDFNPLTLSDLNGLTGNGCIFVPSAGCVDSGNFLYGEYNSLGYSPFGYYNTSTAQKYLDFAPGDIKFSSNDINYWRMPVRLVKAIE